MTVLAVHRTQPNWPADAARPIRPLTIGGVNYWVETNGSIPTEADVLAVIDPSPTEAGYAAAVQMVIEAKARERGYANAVTCASYATSTVPQWQGESVAFVAWRDAVWAQVYEVWRQVQAGERSPPSIDELVSGLPTLEWS